jgi:hypothetical protein
VQAVQQEKPLVHKVVTHHLVHYQLLLVEEVVTLDQEEAAEVPIVVKPPVVQGLVDRVIMVVAV